MCEEKSWCKWVCICICTITYAIIGIIIGIIINKGTCVIIGIACIGAILGIIISAIINIVLCIVIFSSCVGLGFIIWCSIKTFKDLCNTQVICITCMFGALCVVLIFAMYFASKCSIKEQKLCIMKNIRFLNYSYEETDSNKNPTGIGKKTIYKNITDEVNSSADSGNSQDILYVNANQKDLFRAYCDTIAEI